MNILLPIGAFLLLTHVRQIASKDQAIWVANTLAKGSNKESINIGAGCRRPSVFIKANQWGDVKCDTDACGECIYCDVEDLSQFNDKEFSVAFCSHILEHTRDPEHSLKEVQRIADNVVVELPPITDPGAWLTPDHQNIITGNGTQRISPALNWAVVGLGVILGIGMYKNKKS